jgi:hypothetical protein
MPSCSISKPSCLRIADAVVAVSGGRMQIEQTFRDVKNPRWDWG